jgi:hypothetical protein
MHIGCKNNTFTILPSRPKIVSFKLRKEMKPMNVHINLADSKSFNSEVKLMNCSTNSKTSKDTNEHGKVSILDRLRKKHGYSTHRSQVASGRIKQHPKVQ